MTYYKREGQVAERPHLNLPAGTFEEEIGLEGFYGRVSHLYHHAPPTSWKDLRACDFQWSRERGGADVVLKPKCFQASPFQEGDFFESGRSLFWNDEISVWIHSMQRSNSIYFRNADASELYFCHLGSLVLESSFGFLAVQKGDYIQIPKGVAYRWQLDSKSQLLRIESFRSDFKKPDTGLMGQQALYHEEAIKSPRFEAGVSKESTSEIRVQKDGLLSTIEYPFDIRNLSGWCGTLYPYSLNVKDIAPAMSPVAHLPPSINTSFVATGFVVCTFLPRPLEEPKGALRVPFFHSNIDYDEIIFYHEGDFFSRDHMEAGAITLHPRGIHHGPQPKALANQDKMDRTNEVAVMIDTEKSLQVSKYAQGLEVKDYWRSWMKA